MQFQGVWRASNGGAGVTARKIFVLAPACVLSIWASFQIAYAARHGAHDSPDSASYLGMADNLRRGHGLTVPFTFLWDHGYSATRAAQLSGRVPSSVFPPGYSLVLAAVSPLTSNTQNAGRFLDVVLIAANLLLIALLAAKMTSYRSIVAATLPAAMMLFFSDADPKDFLTLSGWWLAHLSIASEPLFTLFFTASIILGATAIARSGRPARLAFIATALLAGGAFLTRYVGASAIITIVGGFVILDARRTMPDRLRRAALFTGIATAPVILFVLGTRLEGASTTSHSFGYHPSASFTSDALAWIGESMLPAQWARWVMIVAALVLLGVAVVAAWWLPEHDETLHDAVEANTLLRLAILAVPSYCIVLGVTNAFFDVNVTAYPRFFVGLRGVIAAAVVAGVYRVGARLLPHRITPIVLVAAFALVAHADNNLVHALRPPVSSFHASVVDSDIAALPRDALIVGNAPDEVYLGSKRTSLMLPSRQELFTGHANPTYAREVDDFVALLRARGGYAYFDTSLFIPVIGADELSRRLPLHAIAREGPFVLYEVDRPR